MAKRGAVVMAKVRVMKHNRLTSAATLAIVFALAVVVGVSAAVWVNSLAWRLGLPTWVPEALALFVAVALVAFTRWAWVFVVCSALALGVDLAREEPPQPSLPPECLPVPAAMGELEHPEQEIEAEWDAGTVKL
jgi:hypothetical protein